MAFDVNNPYFRTKVLTAPPEQLQLMLIEGCIHFVELGKLGLEEKDFEKVFENLSQAKAILFELLNNLKPELAPEVCSNMAALYTFLITEITHSSMQKAPHRLAEVIRLLNYERETWQLLIGKLAEEKGDQAAPPTNPLPTVQAQAPQGAKQTISFSA